MTWYCDTPEYIEDESYCVTEDYEEFDICDNEENCYTYDEYIYEAVGYWANWQEEEWSAWDQTGVTNWGTNLGWCMSDLDAQIGFFESTDVCWEQCSSLFGDVLYAVDFWKSEGQELGDCYCQHDCFCMTDIEDDEVINMTLDSLTVLPEPCEEEWEQDMDDEYDECWETHEDREGETSEEKCYALEGCFFDAEHDECYSAEWDEWSDHEFDW
jgi:hypothetical protein